MINRNDSSLDPSAVLSNLPPPPNGADYNGSPDGVAGSGGGVDMSPADTPAPPPVPARQEQAPLPPQPPEPTMQVGLGREEEAIAAPPPVQEAPPPQKPDSMPLAVYERLRDQWQAERDARAQYEREVAELRAYREQAEPQLAAFRQEWPQVAGIRQEKARIEQEYKFEKAAREFVASEYSQGRIPDLDSFKRTWENDQLLRQAANMPQVIRETVSQQMQAILDQRDQHWQAQVEQQQAQAEAQRREQMVARFESEFAEVERQYPALAGNDGWKRAAFIDWANNGGQKPVKEVMTPYVSAFRSQQAAAIAGQQTRAEVHAALPRTLSGGSSAAVASTNNGSMRPPIEVIRGGTRAIAAWHKQMVGRR